MVIDRLLTEQTINPDQVLGNGNSVKTEAAVISVVINGRADAGICSVVLAREAGLAFVPIT